MYPVSMAWVFEIFPRDPAHGHMHFPWLITWKDPLASQVSPGSIRSANQPGPTLVSREKTRFRQGRRVVATSRVFPPLPT